MLKQAQDHARVSNVKGINPMGRYMGQAKSDTSSDDDSYDSQDDRPRNSSLVLDEQYANQVEEVG